MSDQSSPDKVNKTVIEASALPALDQAPITPFVLNSSLPDSLHQLYCTDVLRFLPGKRLVLKARHEKRNVIIKCFFGSHADRDQQRELNGIHGFQRAKVNTPELITYSSSRDASVVVTAALEPMESFEDIWQQELTDTVRREWLVRISQIIGTLHNAGVQQADIHLDNMLVHNNELYLIDGGGAENTANGLSPKAALENLATFQAVLYPKFDCYLPDVWTSYKQTTPANCEQKSLNDFSDLVQQRRKWREKFVQKALRNCTQFRVEKSWQHFMSVDRELDTEALQEVFNNPDQAMNNGKVIKRGRTNTLSIVTLNNGEKVLIKRYKSTKGLFHKYLRCLRPSRARGCWINGTLLHMLGIKTPRPYAMLEQRFGPLVLCSYIINRFEPATHAMDWFSQSPLPENKDIIASKMGAMLSDLQRALIYHGDLKANNILIVNNEPSLIDLDSMKSYPSKKEFERKNRQDINRFSRNWINIPAALELFAPMINKLNKNWD